MEEQQHLHLNIFIKATDHFYKGKDYKKSLNYSLEVAKKLINQKRFSLALEYYRRCLEIAETHKKNILCDLLLETGFLLYRIGNYSQSLIHFKKAESLSNKQEQKIKSKKGKGLSLYGLRKNSESLKEMRNFILSFKSNDPEIFLCLSSLEIYRHNIKKAEENPNAEYQYGKGKIQAIAAVIEGTVITISGIYIIYEAIKKLNNGSITTLLEPSIWAMIFSIVVTYVLVKYLLKVAQKTDNLVIKADALHYQTDLWSNAAVLVALGLVYMTGIDAIDAVFGLAIGLYIIYSAYEIIQEGIEILLDKALDGNIVVSIAEIISQHPEITSYHWLKTRTDGSTNFVEFHMCCVPICCCLKHIV